MKYSLFTLALPECSPAESAKWIKQAGYDGVEWRCAEQPEVLSPIPNPWSSNRTTLDVKKWKKCAVEHRQITLDHGLEFSNLATYCRADQSDAIQIGIEIAKILDCPRLRVCVPPYDSTKTFQEMFKLTREHFQNATELCRKAELQGLLELHMGNLAPSACLAAQLLEGLDPEHMSAMYDPGNMVIEGFVNWKMGCEILQSHLGFCHAKNMRLRPSGVTSVGAVKWEMEACEMDAGFVNWLDVFKALRSVGYDGWVSSEDYFGYGGTPLHRIQYGLKHLKRCEELSRDS